MIDNVIANRTKKLKLDRLLILTTKPEEIIPLTEYLKAQFLCVIQSSFPADYFFLKQFNFTIIDFDHFCSSWFSPDQLGSSFHDLDVPKIFITKSERNMNLNHIFQKQVFWPIEGGDFDEFCRYLKELGGKREKCCYGVIDKEFIQFLKHEINNSLQVSSLSVLKMKKKLNGTSFDIAISKIQKANKRIADFLLEIEESSSGHYDRRTTDLIFKKREFLDGTKWFE